MQIVYCEESLGFSREQKEMLNHENVVASFDIAPFCLHLGISGRLP